MSTSRESVNLYFYLLGGAVSGYDVPTCVTPTLLIQELNDQNLLRHNQLTSSSTFSDRMSSTDSSSTRNRAKPPPPQRSLGIESNKTTSKKGILGPSSVPGVHQRRFQNNDWDKPSDWMRFRTLKSRCDS